MFALTACSGSGPTTDASSPTVTKPSVSPSSPSAAASDASLNLVVIGDSIPFDNQDVCPGCTLFIDRYADALAAATGRTVVRQNLSQRTGLTLDMLLSQLDGFRSALSGADAIVVAIAHNSIALNADKPCGATFDDATNQLSDWSKVNTTCAADTAAAARPGYDRLFAQIAAWRDGRPTLLTALNKYNDWIGWRAADLTPDQERRTVIVHDAWNGMLCASAKAHGFRCADVYHAFNGRRGDRPAGDLLSSDYTHPSDTGEALIAETLVKLGFAPLAAP
jgi:lysophospholipase L1-like esterase